MLKWIAVTVGAVVALVAALLAAVPWIVDTPRVQAYIAAAASQSLGRPVRFTSLSISAFPLPAVRLRGLQVAEDPRFGSEPFLTVEEGRLRIRLRPLLSGRLELTDLTLQRPRLILVEEGGRLNVASLGPPPGAAPRPPPRSTPGPASPPPSAAVLGGKVRIVAGTIQYVRRGGSPSEFRLEQTELILSPGPRPETFALSGRAVGQPGAVQLSLSDVALAHPPGRPWMESAVSGTVRVDAADVGGLARTALAATALSGPLKGTLKLSGTAGQLAASGELGLERLALSTEQARCPAPRTRQFVLERVRAPLAVTLRRADSAPLELRAAGGTVRVQLSAALASPPLVTLKGLSVRQLQLGPLLVDYLCQRYAVTGPMDLSADASLRADDPTASLQAAGSLRIGPGHIAGGGAVQTLREISGLAHLAASLAAPLEPARGPGGAATPLDFESITATYTVTHGLVRTSDLLLQSKRMTLSGAGTYDLASTRADLAVVLSEGRNQIRGRVTGTAQAGLRVTPTGITAGDRDGVRRLIERLMR